MFVTCVQEALELFICMDPVFVCGVCEVAFASEEGFLWHLNSTKHQDAVSLHASNGECTSQLLLKALCVISGIVEYLGEMYWMSACVRLYHSFSFQGSPCLADISL